MNGPQLYEHEKRYAAMRDAAPELFAAVEYVERWISSGGHEGDDATALLLSQHALAKARGEQA